MALVLAQIIFISEFLAQIRNQRPKIDPSAKFQPNWTKDEGSRISTSNDSENCLMTSYTRGRDDVIKILNAFERFCARVPSYQVWW